MATFEKRGKRWRVQVKIQGERRGKTFDTKAEAAQWAMLEEAENQAGPAHSKVTVHMALVKLHTLFVKEGINRSDVGRALRLQDDPMASKMLTAMDKRDLVEFRDRRLEQVAEGTVRRELNLFRGLFRRCRDDWHYMTHNPFKGFKAPKDPASRKRRVAPSEVDLVRHGFGIGTKLRGDTETQRVGLAFLLGCESAMRSGEMVDLEWPRVFLDRGYVHLLKTKNGDERDVPLTPFAIEILRALPKVKGEPCFNMTDASRDALWRQIRDMLPVVDLHFHDSRSEGIWRLSKKLDVLQLARAIGHRDVNSLLIYYRESAEDMAIKLAS